VPKGINDFQKWSKREKVLCKGFKRLQEAHFCGKRFQKKPLNSGPDDLKNRIEV